MRKQYHFRPGERGLDAWDVDRLLVLVQDLPTEQVPLEAIRERGQGAAARSGRRSGTYPARVLIRAVLVSLVALTAACGGGEGAAQPCGGYVSAEQVRELADVPAVDVTTTGEGSCEYRHKSSLLLSVTVIDFEGGGAGLLPRAVPPEYTRVPARADAFISAGAFPDALVVVDDHTMLRLVPPRTPQQVSGPPLEVLVRAVANAV